MALKQLMLRNKLMTAKTAADEHRKAKTALEERAAALTIREQAAEKAIGELGETATAEERSAVETEVAAIEAEQAALEADTTAHDAKQVDLDKAASDIQQEIDELDERSKNTTERTTTRTNPPPAENRGRKETGMETRVKFFAGRQERDAFFARQEVKEFVENVRSIKTRALTNGELVVPDVMLEIIRDNAEQYSKLSKYVHVQQVSGTSRQNIMGTSPEGVWFEADGELNELDMSLNQIEADGYLVGGIIYIHNTLLNDASNVNLGMEIMEQLMRAIGKGKDRAIIYGTGVKMPLGIVTRLAQTSKPSTWGTNAPTWTDLHESNVRKINIGSLTGAAFFAALIAELGIAKPNYSDTGKTFWAMNRKTHIYIMSKALAFDAAAALLAGVNNQMPIVGGDIVEMEMVGDNEIVGGYGDVYRLIDRDKAIIDSSEHVKFKEFMTAFRGVARADGKPAFGEAFVVVSFDNTDAATSSTFPIDYANTDLGVLGVTAAAGTESGDTVLTVTGTESSGTTLKFRIGDLNPNTGDKVVGYTDLTSGTTQITCAAGKTITVVELDAASRVIKSGKVIAVPKA